VAELPKWLQDKVDDIDKYPSAAVEGHRHGQSLTFDGLVKQKTEEFGDAAILRWLLLEGIIRLRVGAGEDPLLMSADGTHAYRMPPYVEARLKELDDE